MLIRLVVLHQGNGRPEKSIWKQKEQVQLVVEVLFKDAVHPFYKHLNEFIEMPLLLFSHFNRELSAAALLHQERSPAPSQLHSPHTAPEGEGAVVALLSTVLQPQSHIHLSILILSHLLRCTAACMINNSLSPFLSSSRSCKKEDVLSHHEPTRSTRSSQHSLLNYATW